MSFATEVLHRVFENRYNFLAPDSGAHKLPYTCSFHWFYLPDGRLIGVDVVRSDDMGRRALRVFAVNTARELSSLILEGPSERWAPFATDNPPTMPHNSPLLGRGENWLAACASAAGQSIHSASFLLQFKVNVPGKGTGECGLLLAHMNAMDYLRMEISGWIELNEERMELNGVTGYASMHFGDFLPNYAGIASVPPQRLSGPGILVNITDSDDIKHGAAFIENKSIIYGYGSDGVPDFFVTVDKLERGNVPLGRGHLELSAITSFPHVLLDRATTTAVADAKYVPDDGAAISIGQVILDFRGPGYAGLIT
jgi:hypothetical protein